MLGACTETSRLMKADFKANLKTVKKEEEKVKVVTEERNWEMEDEREGDLGVGDRWGIKLQKNFEISLKNISSPPAERRSDWLA